MAVDWRDAITAAALRDGRNGVADSQLRLGNWSPEFYAMRVAEIDREFRASMNDSEAREA